MAKKIYLGIDDVARKIKKSYCGIDDVARKVKKAYIGIGGVARPCMSSEELVYYGEVTPLSVGRSRLSGGAIGDYALFAGGRCTDYEDGYILWGEWTFYGKTDAYDSSLTMRTINYTYPGPFSGGLEKASSASVGDYVLFGGGFDGYEDGDNSFYTDIGVYNSSLVGSAIRNGLKSARTYVSATTIGDYALFCGGVSFTTYGDDEDVSSSANTEAYNASLTRVNSPNLSREKHSAGAVAIGNYALIAGGNDEDSYSSSYQNTVETYDKSLTRGLAESLTGPYEYLNRCGKAGERAIFVNRNSKVVDTYDASLTKTSFTIADNEGQFGPYASVSLGECVVFYNEYSIYSSKYRENNTIEAYDSSCTKTVLKKIPRKASDYDLVKSPAASAVGDYALFAGGHYYDNWNEGDIYSPDVHAVKFMR